MRRRLVSLPALAAVAVLSAACTGGFSPDWTLGPSPSSAAPASASAGASGSAAPSASVPASTAPSPAGSPPAAGGQTVDITASGIAFTTPNVTAPAGAAFTIHFDNQDASVPHNVQIKDASGASVFKGDIFSGVATKDYQVNALTAGTYEFVCDVHPNMKGTLTAG
jgi:plastocyanin